MNKEQILDQLQTIEKELKSKQPHNITIECHVVGAYVWLVKLNESADPVLVLTNEPVPDNNFKTIVDQYRLELSDKNSIAIELIQVEYISLLGFAHGTSYHEKQKIPNLMYNKGNILLSPEFASKLRATVDHLEMKKTETSKKL